MECPHCNKHIEVTFTAGAIVKNSRFKKPPVDMVKTYASSIGFPINAERFVDYYETNGWKVGKNPMKSWQAAVRTWFSRYKENNPGFTPKPVVSDAEKEKNRQARTDLKKGLFNDKTS